MRLRASELAQSVFFGPDGVGELETLVFIATVDAERAAWIDWAASSAALEHIAEGSGGGLRTGTRDRMVMLFEIGNCGEDAIRGAARATRRHEAQRTRP